MASQGVQHIDVYLEKVDGGFQVSLSSVPGQWREKGG